MARRCRATPTRSRPGDLRPGELRAFVAAAVEPLGLLCLVADLVRALREKSGTVRQWPHPRMFWALAVGGRELRVRRRVRGQSVRGWVLMRLLPIMLVGAGLLGSGSGCATVVGGGGGAAVGYAMTGGDSDGAVVGLAVGLAVGFLIDVLSWNHFFHCWPSEHGDPPSGC